MKFATSTGAILSLASMVTMAGAGKIKHIVVLMEENRSFDHFFGYGSKAGLKINGLTGTEKNYVDSSDPTSKSISVNDNAAQVSMCDPHHLTPATTAKIFGNAAAAKGDFTTPTMGGFVENQWRDAHSDYCGVMSAHNPDNLPVITAMAQEFAIMDHFFWCNHLFF
jgi:phospholipase C